ncbi:MAG: hypothetical protein G01um101472_359 [Parcubacteria group bacterium Gr01-1014_72]|nr:MAG: hypothetical protein G01um101472_359 [Parcubacteria group bacterium Gr01-1014_72]
MEPSESRMSLTLPASIVVAGLIVAGAILITKNPAPETAGRKQQAAAASAAAVLPAVEVSALDHPRHDAVAHEHLRQAGRAQVGVPAFPA